MVAALNGRPEGRWTGLEEKRKERRERKRKKEREERDPIFFSSVFHILKAHRMILKLEVFKSFHYSLYRLLLIDSTESSIALIIKDTEIKNSIPALGSQHRYRKCTGK